MPATTSRRESPSKLLRTLVFIAAIALPAALSTHAIAAKIPHLQRNRDATQLIVDDRPYLVLGGELSNTGSSSLEYMETVWPQMKRAGLNTVLVAVAWDWVEPQEGRFDFTLVDGLLEGARRHDLRVVFLWFGSWKNSVSSFAPPWVKADTQRFPRVKIASGKSVEILSPFSEAAREADTKAYVAFMRHLKQVDGERHTVLMIQIQNEVGVLGDSRDRSEPANAAFAAQVPAALVDRLTSGGDSVDANLRKYWQAAGAKTAGTWTELFGEGPQTDEIFMAWHYGRFMGQMTEAGKREYPLPVFTNTWIVQPEDTGPGDYPSGGPEPLVLDVWKAAAPAIDFNAPDIYLPDFAVWAKRFHRADNPLFIPEARGDATGAANAFYAIGAHDAIGYSPFGIDNMSRLLPQRSDSTTQPTRIEELPLPRAYAVLGQLAPLILEHQGNGTMGAALVDRQRPRQQLLLGEFVLNVELWHNRRNPEVKAEQGYCLAIAIGPGEYVVAASNVYVTFTPRTPGPAIAGLATVEAGRFGNGKWITTRRLSGDDILIDYKLAEAAARNQSGSGLIFPPSAVGPTIQRVKLYRYE